MPSKWQRLQLSQQRLPPLLFQYAWTRQGYEIHITDLTYFWSERLPHKAIAKRAEDDATTIDPGEDPEQLNVLLEKIGEALQKGNESVILSSGTQTDSLEIMVTTKLPAPLKPLKWSLRLSKEPLSSLTINLLLPLLREEAEWESRQRLLLNQIKQKDYVLGKLFDKMETLGVDLGSVFPSAAGSRTSRKAITRSDAAKYVKGIAPFEEQAWLAETGVSDEAGLATNLLQEFSQSGDSHDLDTFTQSRSEWWHQLAERSETSAREYSVADEVSNQEDRKPVETKHMDAGGDSTASSDVDEFQRQETPPRLKSQHGKGKASSPKQKLRKKTTPPLVLPSEEDEATASDSESEPEPAPSQRRIPRVSRSPEPTAPQPKAQEGPKVPKGGLGKIGGRGKKETERRPLPSPSPPPSPPAQVREAPKRPRGGLGMIGGKKKQAKEPSPTSAPSPPAQARECPESQEPSESLEEKQRINKDTLPMSSTPAPPAAAKAKRSGKLGMIGGKAKAKASEPARDRSLPPTPDTVMSPEKAAPAKPKADREASQKEESPLPIPAAEKVPSAPPAESETEDQRADRKREELKRSLEAKSKAPAKKKRRF
ncbi:DNA double-strand break repair and VJ recombination XRCC4 N-terminal [Penicillium concentricum]|uniref:Non-homologous end-joining factor 1 n=1 Tax=Penicillium concentricum TaxID=293559 RepID=A0A9W9VK57_9EURO|nr:DNA double-strand break repair and VJ recombination XRCC4 N-terminal [Penicillium concentricum]KAJ5384882.1 DNA double-strand break repair and VJ recombination XRCC4 N-terminal [Penicillium concentricum]